MEGNKPHGNGSSVSTNKPGINNNILLIIYCHYGQQTQHDILKSLGSDSGVLHLRLRRCPKRPPHIILVPHQRQGPCLPTIAHQLHPPTMVPPFLGYSNIFSHTQAPTRFPYEQCIHLIRHRKPSNTDVNRFSPALPPYRQVHQAQIALRHLPVSHQSTNKTNLPHKALQTTSRAA